MPPDTISLLRLSNAQRHVKAELHFVGGVNTIRGATDSGKSTIQRALRWVCFNKPATTNILRRKTKRTDVEIKLGEHSICRARTVSKNMYILDGVMKRGFGKNVPDDISAILNMDPTLHVQRQSDPYFLLAVNSPTERAKELERFTDLSIITRSIQKGRKTVRGIESREEGVRECRKRGKREQERLAVFFAQKESIMLVFSLRDEIDKHGQLLDTLKNKQSIMQVLSGALAKGEKAAALDAEALTHRLTEYETDVTRLHTLQGHYSGLRTLQREYERCATFIDGTDTTELEVLAAELEKEESLLSHLRRYAEDMTRLQCQLRQEKEVEQETNEILSKVKVCKTCGRPLDETTVRGNSGCASTEHTSDLPY